MLVLFLIKKNIFSFYQMSEDLKRSRFSKVLFLKKYKMHMFLSKMIKNKASYPKGLNIYYLTPRIESTNV